MSTAPSAAAFVLAAGLNGAVLAQTGSSDGAASAQHSELLAAASAASKHGSAGHNKNFFIQSADGGDKLVIRGLLQTRYIANFQDSVEDDANGFEQRRARIFFDGHARNKKIKYRIMGDFIEPRAGQFELFDAYLEFNLAEGWDLTVGQFRLPFNREMQVGAAAQLSLDRSQINYTFNLGPKGGRSQGFKLAYSGKKDRAQVAFSDGVGGVNTPFDAGTPDWAVTGRYERLIAGEWGQFRQFSSKPDEGLGILLGGGFHAEERERYQLTGDISVEQGGWTAFGAFYYTSIGLPDNDEQEIIGATVYGGTYITDKWEAFARYEFGTDTVNVDDFSLAAVGVNYRPFGANDVKVTLEVAQAFNEVTSTFDNGRQGFLASVPGDENQTVLRAQLQVKF